MFRSIAIIALSIIHFTASQAVIGQVNINIPRIPAIGKPKPEPKNPGNGGIQDQSNNAGNKTDGKLIYGPQRPTSTPVFLKNSVYVQAKTHNEYWKMKGQRNYSSWVPQLRFQNFHDGETSLNYSVEYLNPNGSAWYSEKLESSGRNADRTIVYKSPSPWTGTLDTKSTDATGVFSFKIVNDDTKETLFTGKFKVGKFSTSNGGPDKNKFEFFVDHDWLMPYGMVGFHHSIDHVGGMPPLVSFWIKGSPNASDLEGRVFYKGQQIASTKDGGGASDYDERTTDGSAAFAPLNRWKRWQFQWRDLLFDNNGTFNRENFPKAFYVDKNPGVYTVKIYHNGQQIREMEFTVGSDGKFVRPSYADQIFVPYHTIILPVKVTAPDEKWNATAWKTESFYGNPIAAFTN